MNATIGTGGKYDKVFKKIIKITDSIEKGAEE